MPIFAAADREVEFGPLSTAESAFDLDGASSAAIPHAAGHHTASRFLGALVLCALFAGAAVLGGSPHGSEVQADTEFLISESHFSQSCSWKCNRKFWGKGHVAQSAQGKYQKCCQGCPGSACKFPCTDFCRQKREEEGSKCSGDATCMDGVQTEHRQCCSRCPGSVCVAEDSEEFGESDLVAFDASSDIVEDASAEGDNGAHSILDSTTSVDKEDALAKSVEGAEGIGEFATSADEDGSPNRAEHAESIGESASAAVKEDATAEAGESAEGLKDIATSADVEEGASSEVAEGADGIKESVAPVDVVEDSAAKSAATSVEGDEGIGKPAASVDGLPEGAEGATDAESIGESTSAAVKEDASAEGSESAEGLKDSATSADVEEGASSEVAEGTDGFGESVAPVDFVEDAAAKGAAASVEGAEGIGESAASVDAEVEALLEEAEAESNKEDIVKTCGGNAAGVACKFPFEYHGVQYTGCTSIDLGQPWCYTSTAGAWGNCNCPAS